MAVSRLYLRVLTLRSLRDLAATATPSTPVDSRQHFTHIKNLDTDNLHSSLTRLSAMLQKFSTDLLDENYNISGGLLG